MKLYYPESMLLHGVNACSYHPFEKYEPIKDKNETAMFWVYFEEDYQMLAQHKGKRYICWHGNDVLRFNIAFKKYINLIRNPEITHIFLNHITQAEMFQLGIYGIQRYIFWGDVTKYEPSQKLTKDCFMCCPERMDDKDNRNELYGELIFNSLAWKYPEWTFHIFGIQPIIPVYCDNVKYYGWIPETEMDEITRDFGLCLRYNSHDGFPQVVCKSLLREQYCLTRLPYDGLTAVFSSLSDLFKAFDAIDADIDGEHVYKNKVTEMINNFDFINPNK